MDITLKIISHIAIFRKNMFMKKGSLKQGVRSLQGQKQELVLIK